MMMQMLGSFAEFEREMIRERTRAGLREARANGRVPGRKRRITVEQQYYSAHLLLAPDNSGYFWSKWFK